MNWWPFSITHCCHDMFWLASTWFQLISVTIKCHANIAGVFIAIAATSIGKLFVCNTTQLWRTPKWWYPTTAPTCLWLILVHAVDSFPTCVGRHKLMKSSPFPMCKFQTVGSLFLHLYQNRFPGQSNRWYWSRDRGSYRGVEFMQMDSWIKKHTQLKCMHSTTCENQYFNQ